MQTRPTRLFLPRSTAPAVAGGDVIGASSKHRRENAGARVRVLHN